MKKEYFWIEKTTFPKCKEEVFFLKGLNIVTGDNNSGIYSHASHLSALDTNDHIDIWRDSFAHSLHPTQLKMEAGFIIENVTRGLQAIVFTDSLFMMRELYLLAHGNNFPIRYINLYFDKNELKVEQADSIDEINHLSLLDENLAQSERYLRIP